MVIDNPFAVLQRDINRLESKQDKIIELLQSKAVATPTPADAPPILSAQQVKQMTGWPNGTFYAKVAEMPEGVVIRGRSKRLMFDREKFTAWLKDPVKPANPATSAKF